MVRQMLFSHPHSIDLSCHWCPRSQRYAGGDALLTYLHNGWDVHDEIYREEYWHGGSRRVLIYYFILVNNGACVTMRVLSNPVIERLLSELKVQTLPTAATQAPVRQPPGVKRQLH